MPKTAKKSATLDTIGHVTDVIEGVPPSHLDVIPLAGYKAGFEAGSPQGVDSIGEFISFNGIGFASSTQPGNVGALLTGDRVVTNGAALLPNTCVPDKVVLINEPISMLDLYAQLSELGLLTFIVGTGTFERYHATAITKAPIFGENIFEHRDLYYVAAPVEDVGVHAAFVGTFADMDSVKEEVTRANLGAVLYRNPFESEGQQITSHTHSLRLEHIASSPEEVGAAGPVAVHHLFADSILRSGRVELYWIKRIRNLRSSAGLGAGG